MRYFIRVSIYSLVSYFIVILFYYTGLPRYMDSSQYFLLRDLNPIEIIVRNFIFFNCCFILTKLSSGFLGILFLSLSYYKLGDSLAEMGQRLSLSGNELINLLFPHAIGEFIIYGLLLNNALGYISFFFNNQKKPNQLISYFLGIFIILISGFLEVYFSYPRILEYVIHKHIPIF